MIYTRRRRYAEATTAYYLLTAVSTFCYALSFTLNIVYMATTVGLDAFQLVLVGRCSSSPASCSRSPRASWPTCTAAGSRC